MASSQNPKARREGFIVQPMDGELLLTNSDVTHLLNPVAASVWQKCDGHHSTAQIARQLALDEFTVEYALQQLHTKELLEAPATQRFGMQRISRREFLKKGAIAAAAMPVIKTLQLPSPQNGGSGCNCPACTGQPCAIDDDCDLGGCVNGCCILF